MSFLTGHTYATNQTSHRGMTSSEESLLNQDELTMLGYTPGSAAFTAQTYIHICLIWEMNKYDFIFYIL